MKLTTATTVLMASALMAATASANDCCRAARPATNTRSACRSADSQGPGLFRSLFQMREAPRAPVAETMSAVVSPGSAIRTADLNARGTDMNSRTADVPGGLSLTDRQRLDRLEDDVHELKEMTRSITNILQSMQNGDQKETGTGRPVTSRTFPPAELSGIRAE